MYVHCNFILTHYLSSSLTFLQDALRYNVRTYLRTYLKHSVVNMLVISGMEENQNIFATDTYSNDLHFRKLLKTSEICKASVIVVVKATR